MAISTWFKMDFLIIITSFLTVTTFAVTIIKDRKDYFDYYKKS